MPEIILVGLLSQRSKTTKAALFLSNMNKFKKKIWLWKLQPFSVQQ